MQKIDILKVYMLQRYSSLTCFDIGGATSIKQISLNAIIDII